MSESDWVPYRHKADDSIRYEVRVAEPRTDPVTQENVEQYEVRRIDNPGIFGSEPFVVDAVEFEQTYEPVQERE